MSEILQVRTKQDKAEAILYTGHNWSDIRDTLPVNSWKMVGEVIHVFDDVYDGYQILSEGQFVVSTAKDEETQVQVFDGPVFYDLYTTRTHLGPRQAFELRTKAAEMASNAFQGAAYAPGRGTLTKIAQEIEEYIKGDDYE